MRTNRVSTHRRLLAGLGSLLAGLGSALALGGGGAASPPADSQPVAGTFGLSASLRQTLGRAARAELATTLRLDREVRAGQAQVARAIAAESAANAAVAAGHASTASDPTQQSDSCSVPLIMRVLLDVVSLGLAELAYPPSCHGQPAGAPAAEPADSAAANPGLDQALSDAGAAQGALALESRRLRATRAQGREARRIRGDAVTCRLRGGRVEVALTLLDGNRTAVDARIRAGYAVHRPDGRLVASAPASDAQVALAPGAARLVVIDAGPPPAAAGRDPVIVGCAPRLAGLSLV